MCCRALSITILIGLIFSLFIIYIDNNKNLGYISNIKYIEYIELTKNSLDLWNFQYDNSQKIVLKNCCPSKTRNFNIFYQGKLLALVTNFDKKQSSKSNIQDAKNKILFKIFENGEIFENKTKIGFWYDNKFLNINNITLATIYRHGDKLKIHNLDNELNTILLLALAGKLIIPNQDICNQYFLSVSIILIIIFFTYLTFKLVFRKRQHQPYNREHLLTEYS